jgi:hypothetical protein
MLVFKQLLTFFKPAVPLKSDMAGKKNKPMTELYLEYETGESLEVPESREFLSCFQILVSRDNNRNTSFSY